MPKSPRVKAATPPTPATLASAQSTALEADGMSAIDRSVRRSMNQKKSRTSKPSLIAS